MTHSARHIYFVFNSHLFPHPFLILKVTMSKSRITIRLAQESDIPAIHSLFLTSFRQFPLFEYLFSPLNRNLDFAHDTVFYWRKRLIIGLLNPETSIIVAEAPAGHLQAVEGDESDSRYKQAVSTLKWTESNGLSTTSATNSKNVVVGFAIWRIRKGESESGVRDWGLGSPSMWSRLRSKYTEPRI